MGIVVQSWNFTIAQMHRVGNYKRPPCPEDIGNNCMKCGAHINHGQHDLNLSVWDHGYVFYKQCSLLFISVLLTLGFAVQLILYTILEYNPLMYWNKHIYNPIYHKYYLCTKSWLNYFRAKIFKMAAGHLTPSSSHLLPIWLVGNKLLEINNY